MSFSATTGYTAQINTVLTNKNLLQLVTNILKNPNAYLQIDATVGIVTNSSGIDGRNTYLYVVMVGVPNVSDSCDYYVPFGMFLSSNQGQTNISSLLGQLLGKLRKVLNGREPKFSHVTADNCAALRHALAVQLNGCNTIQLMKKASQLLIGQATLGEALQFTPLHSCQAHQIKSDADCAKYSIDGLPRLLFLRVWALMQTSTNDW